MELADVFRNPDKSGSSATIMSLMGARGARVLTALDDATEALDDVHEADSYFKRTHVRVNI